ncbi:hypothetical protein ASPBRDRAFT_204008 [Aspergillus brasiliensis CBS 101740]|uniref:Uncharacterized protein n=1 Tax=Aspergillus brasiliensis (strain CBS 101740 / IMI 381727 / IBT 21946) TaxID=767769 RepID=A0A1L9UXI2_ASPBC|nr:hypothetical protein ASPBRDRAFT_204008 [Aspergillus brasiliensis CBS 101740]
MGVVPCQAGQDCGNNPNPQLNGKEGFHFHRDQAVSVGGGIRTNEGYLLPLLIRDNISSSNDNNVKRKRNNKPNNNDNNNTRCGTYVAPASWGGYVQGSGTCVPTSFFSFPICPTIPSLEMVG